MLNRQRVLVEMLRLAHRPVKKLELVKWAFLLKEESRTKGGPAFYDFVPYRFGPYSFSLAREIKSLVDIGLVKETEGAWDLGKVEAKNKTLPPKLSADVQALVRRLKPSNATDLLNHVYSTYPEFTVNSERNQRTAKPSAPPSVYTAGYEGLQVDRFLNLLVQSGIQRLIDVRNNPVSRRYGYHKTTLSRLCGYLGISYEHVPELGITPDERRDAGTSKKLALFDRYERALLPAKKEFVSRVADWIAKKPSVLVCMEADPGFCHRSRLAGAVARITGLPVVHLGPPP
jgi:uncharacterized protein (DUF488 family)